MKQNFSATGVDGCRAGWLAVNFDGQAAQLQLCRTLPEVRTFAVPERPILIDMPIGFVTEGEEGRACDTLARRYLSPLRHGSVFTPPCRAAVYADLAEASAVNYSLTGKKLSQQSLNIIPKMRELDAFLLQQAKQEQGLWREAHPEVVFAALNGRRPLENRKKTVLGEAQRLQLLRPFFSGAEAWYPTVRNQYPRKEVQPDDIIDALGLAVANYLILTEEAEFTAMPQDPELDSKGLPMRIVFANLSGDLTA